MSLFRKPKKIQRRVFSSGLDEEQLSDDQRMDVDENELVAPPPPIISLDKKKSKHKDGKKHSKSDGTDKNIQTKALLSFADEEEDDEVFQVRKSSHSKKVMRMMDKERRKKKREERDGRSTVGGGHEQNGGSGSSNSKNNSYSNSNSYNLGSTAVLSSPTTTATSSKYKSTSPSTSSLSAVTTVQSKEQYKINKSDSIQTEIRTDDFVLVVKKSEPDLILNGRAALCAGRDDMSDEEQKNSDDDHNSSSRHRFSKPERLKQVLESGSIPDAAMIHEARKRRQKAREQGDFIPVEEPKETPKMGSRLAREDVEGDNSDDEERVDMNAITGIKEREERREQFYSVENDYSEEDSDHETNEWENQQIRKGVTGAQILNAQHDAVLSRFIIKPTTNNSTGYGQEPPSTSMLLEQAYAKCSLEKPQQIMNSTKVKKDKGKPTALRTSKEIKEAISTRLTKLRELNAKHIADVDEMESELKALKLQELDCTQRAPVAASKYRFYQEVKCYVTDLVDCLNEKTAQINDLEKRTLQLFSKHQTLLIERRRQDVRDQAKEMTEASSNKPTLSVRGREYEDQQRRAAEREGRRTRRRCEREKNGLMASHLDGMSSDDETSDRYQEQFQNNLEKLVAESEEIFSDANDEFFKVDLILMKFYAWRKTDMESYKDAFVNLCLPKILGPLIRLEMMSWSPLLQDYKDIEKMNWYLPCMNYAWTEDETESSLRNDPDVNLVPTIIERIIIPKVTDIVNECWDPLSTTQTLRLIGFVNRLGRDYPLKDSSKPLQRLFNAVLDKMKLSLENDVFIPIFPKQVQEARSSFFQRQFSSGLKLFRNFLSWQMIIADKPLRELAIGALLNRYLLLAMRVCTPYDAISKAYVVVNTLPTVWLQPKSETLNNLELFISYIKKTMETVDAKNPQSVQTFDKAKQILQRLHSL